MPRTIYSILIGINDYPPHYQLFGCVSDVQKVEQYLLELAETTGHIIDTPLLLLNEKATKREIVDSLQKALLRLTSEDSLFIYYSGHGTEEISQNRFKDDHNGLLQSVVCYHTTEKSEPYLLADKELRYLFNSANVKGHVVAIFDCCHSGDITRSELSEKQMRRMSVQNAQRPYDEFIFAEEVAEREFQHKSFNELFPDANIVSISACDSNQSAWEDLHGGVFTRNMLEVLKTNNGMTTYNELVTAIEVSIRQRTQEKQTPTIDVLGDRTYHQLTSWLGLHGNELKTGSAFLKFNKKIGWVLSKGQLHGLEAGDKIEIRLEDLSQPELTIEKVELNSCTVEDPSMDGIFLDPKNTYPVIPKMFTQKPVLAINNLDENKEVATAFEEGLKGIDAVIFSESLPKCDFELVLFKGTAYFAVPNLSYQPLNKVFDLKDFLENRNELKQYLEVNCTTLSNWFHFDLLNFSDGFSEIPIEVAIKSPENEQWQDVTNGTISLTAEKRHPGKKVLYQSYSVKVTNTTEKDLYVTVLAVVSSLCEISAYPFENRTILLTPDASKEFENALFFDHYQEIYNWEFTTVNFKFIVNNHSNISTAIAGIVQRGFEEPLTHLGSLMGARGLSDFEPQEKNAVYGSKVILKNPLVNKITGELPLNWDWYKNEEYVFSLLKRLYPSSEMKRMEYVSAAQNNHQ